MRKILITGASRGLGKVAAEAFSKQGDTVIPFTRQDCDYLHLDRWDGALPNDLDVVLHCAGGGLGLRGPYIPAKSFYDLLAVNLLGGAEINRLVIPDMQARRKGNIVHVCSIASGEAVGSVGYNTIKSALAAYVRSLGRELAPFGVVVAGISPGGFQAPDNAMERLQASNPAAYREFVEKRLPRGHMGKAEELIPLLKFLCSDEASMMGGCVVPIDGGEGHYY
jgi:3-oxoacyl-[acyl-carrier protein] reductase